MDGGYSVWLRPTGFLNYRLVASGKTWERVQEMERGLARQFPGCVVGISPDGECPFGEVETDGAVGA